MDPARHFQWDSPDKSPLPAPFIVNWSGSIYFPEGYGKNSLAINTDGAAELLIDGKSVLKTFANGLQLTAASMPFVGGFHTFTLTYHSNPNLKELTLLWKNSNPDFVSIPRSVYLTLL